jgi:hypothetical protein
MPIDEWLKIVQATPAEAKELRLYLAFLRFKRLVEGLV